jgi:hypothetical protein
VSNLPAVLVYQLASTGQQLAAMGLMLCYFFTAEVKLFNSSSSHVLILCCFADAGQLRTAAGFATVFLLAN